MTESSEITQHTLYSLSCAIVENFQVIQDYFGFELRKYSTKYVGNCPIHSGDKHNALNLYHYGDYVGNWKCYTQQCEEVFINSAFGFVRGLLSMARYKWTERGDQMASIFETVELVNKLLEVDAVDVPTDMDKIKFISQTNNGIKQAKIIGKIPKQQVRSQLEFPAKYLTNRGFSPQVLDRYDVGLCNNRTKEMYQRIVVPIYDDSGQYMVGCTCRSIYEKCPLCKLWHNPKIPCPQKWHEHMFSKWKHSGFKRDFHLYNSWFACKHIQMTNQVIVVESPGNVWKLEEAGIHNSVAIFGTYISKQQTGLLNKMGAMYVTVIGDNDKAGDTMCEIIQKNKMWKVERIKVPQGYDDLGDMPINKITELLKEKNDV